MAASLLPGIVVALTMEASVDAPPAIDSPAALTADATAQPKQLGAPMEEAEKLGEISREATRFQLSATQEKSRAEYLKNKLERIKLESNISIEENMKEIASIKESKVGNNMIPLANMMPVDINGNLAKESITPTPKKSEIKIDLTPYLLEVSGIGGNLISKIQINNVIKTYSVGDKVNGSAISSISSGWVELRNGVKIAM